MLFIQKITPKLLLIELMLRNRVDGFMREQYKSQDWFFEIEEMKTKLNALGNCSALTHDQIISRLSFGAWTTAMSSFYEKNRDCPSLIDLSVVSLKNYLSKNEDLTMKPFKQMGVVFDLVRKIRNRAFHLENMYKIKSGYGRYKFRIQMQDIESFLDSVMKSFDRDFYEKELKKHFP